VSKPRLKDRATELKAIRDQARPTHSGPRVRLIGSGRASRARKTFAMHRARGCGPAAAATTGTISARSLSPSEWSRREQSRPIGLLTPCPLLTFGIAGWTSASPRLPNDMLSASTSNPHPATFCL
jgi:hypothetical protein